MNSTFMKIIHDGSITINKLVMDKHGVVEAESAKEKGDESKR